MTKKPDTIVRAMTADGAFRVLAAVTTDTVRGAALAQEVSGPVARRLGELMTGAVLVREAMAPQRRVQILLKDAGGRARMVADAHPAGWNRGVVNPGVAERPDTGDSAVLEVLYTLQSDMLQQGIVALPGGGDISTGLMTYMQESEQVVSMIAVRAVPDSAHATGIAAAGGYMVQLMPGASREALERMTERLAAFATLDAVLSAPDVSPQSLSRALVGSDELVPMATTYLCFGCNCDHARVLAGVGTLSAGELREIIAQGEPLEIVCDSCRKQYTVTPAELEALLSSRPAQDTGKPQQD